ncbi:MAG: hypothetical protein R8P61_05890 [Bacteroidia bacterium]|nr:hypothetical protein [Bacteroidia bacterium]
MDIQEIQKLISQGRIQKALDAIDKHIEKEDPRKKDFILISSQFNMLKRDEMMGLVMHEEVQQSQKKILQSLLDLFM